MTRNVRVYVPNITNRSIILKQPSFNIPKNKSKNKNSSNQGNPQNYVERGHKRPVMRITKQCDQKVGECGGKVNKTDKSDHSPNVINSVS